MSREYHAEQAAKARVIYMSSRDRVFAKRGCSDTATVSVSQDYNS